MSATGPQGKRGEKGDHGQHGEVGITGPKGDTGKDGRNNFGGLALVILILVAGFSILAFGINKANTAASQAKHAAAQADVAAQDAHKALCALYTGDLRQAQDTLDYLGKHPDGLPSLGLTKAVLLRGVRIIEGQAKAVNPGGCDVPNRLKSIAKETEK